MLNEVLENAYQAFTNKYFIYLLIIVVLFIVIKEVLEYKTYLKTCIALKQEPKLGGYITNAIFSILSISVLLNIPFLTYSTFKKKGFNQEELILVSRERESINEKFTQDPKQILLKPQHTANKKPIITNKKFIPIALPPIKTKSINKPITYKRPTQPTRNIYNERKKLLLENKKLKAQLKIEKKKRLKEQELLKAMQDVN